MLPLHATGWPNSWGSKRKIALADALAELDKADEIKDVPAVVYCDPQQPRWSPQCTLMTFPDSLRQCVEVLRLMEDFDQIPFSEGYAFALPGDADRAAISASLTALGVPHCYRFS